MNSLFTIQSHQSLPVWPKATCGLTEQSGSRIVNLPRPSAELRRRNSCKVHVGVAMAGVLELRRSGAYDIVPLITVPAGGVGS